MAIGAALTLTAGVAAAQAPPPPPAYGAPITLEEAKKVMAGNVVMLQRMDGTQLGSAAVARDKAWSAVAFRRPTKVFEDSIAQGGANLRLLRLTGASPIEGGIPLTRPSPPSGERVGSEFDGEGLQAAEGRRLAPGEGLIGE